MVDVVRVFFGGRGASQPAQEVEVLGSQPLSALVDRIECLYDRPEIYAPPSWKRSHGLVRSNPTLAKHAQTFRVIILTHAYASMLRLTRLLCGRRAS